MIGRKVAEAEPEATPRKELFPQGIGFFPFIRSFQQYAQAIGRHGKLQIVRLFVQRRKDILHLRSARRHTHGFFIRRVVADVHIGAIMLLQGLLRIVYLSRTKLREYQPVNICNIHVIVLRRDGERTGKSGGRRSIVLQHILRHADAVA